MFKAIFAIPTFIFFATSALAQSPTVKSTPGHQEAVKPSKGPGASDYAPGQKMQNAKKSGTFSGPGASDYAPSRQTTTGSSATKKK
jgi:hypothetical protein